MPLASAKAYELAACLPIDGNESYARLWVMSTSTSRKSCLTAIHLDLKSSRSSVVRCVRTGSHPRSLSLEIERLPPAGLSVLRCILRPLDAFSQAQYGSAHETVRKTS